jgi:hypothetical protein
MDLRDALHRIRIMDILRVFYSLTVRQQFTHYLCNCTLPWVHPYPMNALVKSRRMTFHGHESKCTDWLYRFHNGNSLFKCNRSYSANELISIHQRETIFCLQTSFLQSVLLEYKFRRFVLLARRIPNLSLADEV